MAPRALRTSKSTSARLAAMPTSFPVTRCSARWARASCGHGSNCSTRCLPYHVGSNMAHGVSVSHAEFEPGALKYQAGTPDVAGPVGLAAAMRLFDRVGHDAIRQHDEALATQGLARLRAIPHVRLIGIIQPDHRVPVF